MAEVRSITSDGVIVEHELDGETHEYHIREDDESYEVEKEIVYEGRAAYEVEETEVPDEVNDLMVDRLGVDGQDDAGDGETYVCGAETADGSPCQNPVDEPHGRCHIPSHQNA